MGNAMAAVLKKDRRHLWVKIMKTDGTVTKLSSPVNAKEVLLDKPDHGIFEADAVRRLGVRCRPLPRTAQLEGGRMYFLIPLPRQAPGCLAKTWQLEMFRRSFSLNDLSSEEFDRDESMGIRDFRVSSSGGEGSTVRVKLRLRKHELASIVSGNGNLAMTDALRKTIQMQMQKQKNPRDSMSRPVNLGWKPNLDSIAELKSLSPAT